MKQLIQSVQIIDFRSFDDKTVPLNGVTCLVGANESGKTNLLEAISLSKIGDISDPANKLTLKQQDTRKNSHKADSLQLPEIRYLLSIELITDAWLKDKLQLWKINEMLLVREGNELRVELSSLPEGDILLKNLTASVLNVISEAPTPSAAPPEDGSTGSVKNEKIKREAKDFSLPPSGFALLSSEGWSAFSENMQSEVTEGKLGVLQGEDFRKEIEAICLREINKNLKVFFWSYDKDIYTLPEMINIEDILSKWDERPVIRAIFKLGGYSFTDLPNLLQNRTETDSDNIFDKLSKKITQQIRSKWSSNKNLEIQIRHKSDHLKIGIADPGYSIDPQYRSEGMRWFLAFVIGIIAEADELKDYVIIIDEPALHLHPGGQRDVLGEINRMAQENQVIYSTHSHFMIDRRYSERVLFLMKDDSKEYALTDFKKPTQQDVFRDPLLRAALLYSVSDISYLNEKNVLVEGWFDKRIIELTNTWLIKNDPTKSYNPNLVSVIDCLGGSKISQHSALYQANNLFCIGVYDSDTEGENARVGNKQLIEDLKISLDLISGVTQKFTMEDMIPIQAFDEALAEWEVKNEKLNPPLNKPRMKKHALPAITLHMQPMLTVEDPDQDVLTLERLRLKHALEDLIVQKFEKYLENATTEDPELSNLIKLIERISVLTS